MKYLYVFLAFALAMGMHESDPPNCKPPPDHPHRPCQHNVI